MTAKPKDDFKECGCSILNQTICFKHYEDNMKLARQQTAQEIFKDIDNILCGKFNQFIDKNEYKEIKQKYLGDDK